MDRLFTTKSGAAIGGETGSKDVPDRVDSRLEGDILETMVTKSEVEQQALDLPLPDWQVELIRERLAALDESDLEDRSMPWSEVRDRVFWRG